MVALQLLDFSHYAIWMKFCKYVCFFVPGAQGNKDNKILQSQIILIAVKRLPYTELLISRIVCHLAELNFIKNYSKTIDFFSCILASVDKHQENGLNRTIKHRCTHGILFKAIYPAFYYYYNLICHDFMKKSVNFACLMVAHECVKEIFNNI